MNFLEETLNFFEKNNSVMITSKKGIECIKRDLLEATNYVKEQSFAKKTDLSFYGVSGALKNISKLVDKHETYINNTGMEFENLKYIINKSGELLNNLEKIEKKFEKHLDVRIKDEVDNLFRVSKTRIKSYCQVVESCKDKDDSLVKEIKKVFITG